MVTTIHKVIFPNSTQSVQHVSSFSIPSTFTKRVTQLGSVAKNLPQLLHNIT